MCRRNRRTEGQQPDMKLHQKVRHRCSWGATPRDLPHSAVTGRRVDDTHKPIDLKRYWQDSCKKKTNNNKRANTFSKREWNGLCPNSQISSALIPAQSPAAHNQTHMTKSITCWSVQFAGRISYWKHSKAFLYSSTMKRGLCIKDTPVSVVLPKKTWMQNLSYLWSTKCNSVNWRSRAVILKSGEIHFPVEFQPWLNSPSCDVLMILKTLSSILRCVWLGLELNSAGKWISRARLEYH